MKKMWLNPRLDLPLGRYRKDSLLRDFRGSAVGLPRFSGGLWNWGKFSIEEERQ